jgi:antitoxin VapB
MEWQTAIGHSESSPDVDFHDSICYGICLGSFPMGHERHVKLFKNGRSQAVRIPREFELPGEDAIMRKEKGRLVIEPAPPRSLLALLKTLAPIEEEFAPINDPYPEAVDL